MNARDLARFESEARTAVAAGDLEGAVRAYQSLERSAPREGRWPAALAELYRTLGLPELELDATYRAARRHLAEGEPMPAVVLLKRMMDLSPSDERTRESLDRLYPLLKTGTVARPGPVSRDADGWEPVLPLGTQDLDRVHSVPVFTAEEVEEAVAPGPGPGSSTRDLLARPFPLSPFLAALKETSFRALVAALRTRRLYAKEVVFRQGDRGESLYVVGEGQVSVRLEQPATLELARLGPGEIFGEIALITEQARTATVQAEEDTVLLELDRGTVKEVSRKDPQLSSTLLWFLRDRLVSSLVRTHPLFHGTPDESRRQVLDLFRYVQAGPGSVLAHEGAPSPGFSIVLAGQATVLVDGKAIGRLGPGDLFGESSLLFGEPSEGTVRAETPVVLLHLPCDEFATLSRRYPELATYVARMGAARRTPEVRGEAPRSMPLWSLGR